jgi:hypothetical protein
MEPLNDQSFGIGKSGKPASQEAANQFQGSNRKIFNRSHNNIVAEMHAPLQTAAHPKFKDTSPEHVFQSSFQLTFFLSNVLAC